ncbi:MAG: hypothetical protein ACR2P0_18305 [Acidimicrobiales bacterium]
MLIDPGSFAEIAIVIAIGSIPMVFVMVAFLHAARVPQWVWAFSSRTQVVWMAMLLLGVAVVPVGVGLASWYLWKIRPELSAIERGDMARLP